MEITKETIEKFIQDQYWEYREVGSEFQIISGCPFCKDTSPNHFYMNQNTGMYNCHRCGVGGSILTLRKQIGGISNDLIMQKKDKTTLKKAPVIIRKFDVTDEMVEQNYQKMLNTSNIFEWLTLTRGLTKETLEHFKVGWNGKYITFPVYQEGKLVTMRYRKNPFIDDDKPKYLSHPGSKAVLFNSDILKLKAMGTTIVEGELDLMKFHQEVHPMVVTSAGCNTFKDEWVELFKGISKINLCLDNDEPGQKAALEIAKKLGLARCYNVVLTKTEHEKKKDISDYFNLDKKTKADFKKLYEEAKKFPELAESQEKISHVSDIIEIAKDQLLYGKKLKGVLTGYPALDDIMESMLPGDLVILAGQTGVGKSQTAISFASNMLKSGKNVMFFSLEMMPSELVQRFITMSTNIPLTKYASITQHSKLSTTDISKLDSTVSVLKNYPLFLYTGNDTLGPKLLEDVSINSVKKYGADVIFIDHLHYFARGDAKTRSVEIGDIVRGIKMLARKLEVPIVLISHLRKIGNYSNEPNIDDLRDTSMTGQDADLVLLLMRDKTNADKDVRNKMKIRVAKNRHGREDDIDFELDKFTMKLKEVSYVSTQLENMPEDTSDYKDPQKTEELRNQMTLNKDLQ